MSDLCRSETCDYWEKTKCYIENIGLLIKVFVKNDTSGSNLTSRFCKDAADPIYKPIMESEAIDQATRHLHTHTRPNSVGVRKCIGFLFSSITIDI